MDVAWQRHPILKVHRRTHTVLRARQHGIEIRSTCGRRRIRCKVGRNAFFEGRSVARCTHQ
jgi:hypothetical protein